MKAKRNFEFNPRHPLIHALNEKVRADSTDSGAADMLTSLYMASVLQAGYQLSPEETNDFAARMTAVMASGLGIAPDAALLPEAELPEEVAEEEEADEALEEESLDEPEAASGETPGDAVKDEV